MTSEEIESCFVAGRDAPENATCPHHPATLAAHWWTRGFAYTARLNRALTAEREAKQLRAQRDTAYGYGSDAGIPPWMA